MARAKGKVVTVLNMDIIELWAAGMSNTDISKKLDCSIETVRAVKANNEYKRLFFERQNAQIIELLPLAVKRLSDMLTDDTVQASVQIAAIKEVFDRAHLTELLDAGNKDIKITVSYE
jgi:uncharacterized protein (DUF433 family)